MGRIDGVMGEPLAETFHRLHGSRLAAIGDRAGALTLVPGGDPFGAESPVAARRPGFRNAARKVRAPQRRVAGNSRPP